mmetsp:Transcript_7371/g.18505  ORF Transcript_7371/g.18505 Transcript_7371/m.18505 type:complete len:413 (-) Transcript_7371:137-1375(-)
MRVKMARSADGLLMLLVCACLSQLQPAVASSLSSVLSGFAGQTEVDCKAVCDAMGRRYHGSSMYYSGSSVMSTCKCRGGWVKVNCEVDFEQRFSQCCEDGKSCEPSESPSELEDEMKEALEVAEEGSDSLAEDTDELPEIEDGVDASNHGVPTCHCDGAVDQLTKDEIATALTLQNKMRKAVGTPALAWNCNLMCQAQKHADNCQFQHSASYASPIKAGENLASGSDGELAAWMWFSEYGNAASDAHADASCCGHFTAMVWKSTKHLGCGVCRDNSGGYGGVYVCQYAASPPNFGNSKAFAKNVPVFEGTAAQYKHAGLDADKAEEMFESFQSWGLQVGDVFERFYPAGFTVAGLRSHGAWSRSAVIAAIGASAAAVVFALAAHFAFRRHFSRSVAVSFAGDEEQVRALTVD